VRDNDRVVRWDPDVLREGFGRLEEVMLCESVWGRQTSRTRYWGCSCQVKLGYHGGFVTVHALATRGLERQRI
jgi:hypothetical protein